LLDVFLKNEGIEQFFDCFFLIFGEQLYFLKQADQFPVLDGLFDLLVFPNGARLAISA